MLLEYSQNFSDQMDVYSTVWKPQELSYSAW